MPNKSDLAGAQPVMLRRPLGAGRVGTYTALGASAGMIPLPWIPEAVTKRIRGAMAHDVCSRFGLTLTPEARSILSEPTGVDGSRSILSQGVAFAVTRVLGRFTPIGLLPPVRRALSTFLLGHLMHRYFEVLRTERATRIDIEEARKLRRAIDQAIVAAVTTDHGLKLQDSASPGDDMRDDVTRFLDGVLISVAGLPGWLVKRVEAAFDDSIGRS